MLLHPGSASTLQLGHFCIGDAIEHVRDGRLLWEVGLSPGVRQWAVRSNGRVDLIDGSIADEYADQQGFEFSCHGMVIDLERPIQCGPNGRQKLGALQPRTEDRHSSVVRLAS